MKTSPALTLIELLVSITIFSLITAVSIPAFSNFNQRRQLDRYQEQIRTDLRAMQNQAVSGAKGSRWAIVFDASSDSYQMGEYDSGLINPQTKTIPGDVGLATTATVVFEKLTGESVNGSQTISINLGSDNRDVVISAGGSIE